MSLKNNLLSSIIIPAFGRPEKVYRAVKSILHCPNCNLAEIIIVDDNSIPPITCELLRSCDSIIRIDKRSGAAIARNTGIKKARGKIIYLLDSDDYFIDVDFKTDFIKINGSNSLWFSEIHSQNYHSSFPNNLTKEIFFNSIFFKHRFICQTSSLSFEAKLNILFDETLPKHQDWDLTFTALFLKRLPVKKKDGIIYFDRSDKSSVSRTIDSKRSMIWFQKLCSLETTYDFINIQQIRFHLFSKDPEIIPWSKFLTHSIQFLLRRKTSIRQILTFLYFRIKRHFAT